MIVGSSRYAGVELGGTKSIAILWQDGVVLDRSTVPTTTPVKTLGLLRDKIEAWTARQPLDGLGIATFGPVRLDPLAADYGEILATPKPGWTGAQVLATLGADIDCPIGINTDVNAAALAEYRWGAGQGCSSLVYLTIGTGLGGGVLIEGRPVHGRLHPEIGHILTRRAAGDRFAGVCPFHGDCIEGLISGPALQFRFGKPPADVPPDAPEWKSVVHDLGQLLATLVHLVAPQRILVGGGVGLGASHLVPRAIAKVETLLGAYYPGLGISQLSSMISNPALGQDAGPLGAIALVHPGSPRG